jgi:hypothetical protein
MIESIKNMTQKIEERYIGFGPNTSSVKPVHIANGLFRTIVDETYSAKLLNRFVVSEFKKAQPTPGHDLASVYDDLTKKDRIDSRDISPGDLPKFRRLLKNVVGADSAVFAKGMASYTGGHRFLLTRDSIAQDGGELLAVCLSIGRTKLFDYLKKVLQEEIDIITALSSPLLPHSGDEDESGKQPSRISPSNDTLCPFLREPVYQYSNGELTEAGKLWNGLFDAADTLTLHLEQHPNKLFNLRLTVLFACFALIRHLASLEAYYVPEASDNIPPFLLDFSNAADESVAKSSLQTYTRASQSIVRFYGWAFADQLEAIFEDPKNLFNEPAPLYESRSTRNKETKKSQREAAEAAEIWEIAKQRAQDEENQFRVFGEAIYDMLSTQASADATRYMHALGIRAGIFYPPNQMTHRFSPKQDVLEMLVRGAVVPGETIDIAEIQDRFWNRYRLIIGGRLQDEQELQRIGVYQIDRNALLQNRKRFGHALQQLDFAEMLADGVLQVGL